MKKIYSLAAMMLLGAVNAQTDIRVFDDIGTILVDINSNGQALFQRGYYDYNTGVSTPIEEGAKETNGINDLGIVAGAMGYTTVDGFNTTEAAYKKDGEWHRIGYFPGTTPTNSWFGDALKVSKNGKYITGQISTSAIRTYPYVYNTETGSLKKLNDGDLYWLYGRGEGINDAGYVAGFVDREDLTQQGTLWAPAYFDPDGNIHYIDIETPEDGEAADINNEGIIVGYKGNKAFTYNVNTGEYKSFKSTDTMIKPVFTQISDNGLIIGYAGEIGSRDVIVYHKNLVAPIFLKDYLISKGLEIPTIDGKLGTGMGISEDGKFLCGFDNQGPPAPFASGWVVRLEELPMGDGCLEAPNGMNPATVFVPACTESNETITTDAKTGQYSLVQLTAGKEYLFATSVGTDFLTLANEEGSMVLKYGTGEISYIPTTDQIVRFSANLNDDCAASDETRTKFVTCRAPMGCEWTVTVSDDMIGDEVSWYLKNEGTGEILLSGENYGEGYSDTQTVFADGPLTFYIEAYGDWNDNTPSYSVSNGSQVVVSGTMNGGDSKTFTDLNCFLGTDQANLTKLSYYPNPTTGILNLEAANPIATASVFAMDGKLALAPASINAKSGSLNLSALTAGSYIVSLTMKNGSVQTFKIIKK